MKFVNKVCLITGAGSGIGRQLAVTLAKEKARLILSDINEVGLRETADFIGGLSSEDLCLLDVSDYTKVKQHIEDAVVRHNRLDYIFNNAGIAVAADARDYDIEHWRSVVEINLMGVVHGSDSAYKIMARQGFGHIVNISSLSGLIPFPTNVPYATTKHAVVGLSTSLRVEGEALGVKVSVVCPGFIESNIYVATESLNVDRDKFLQVDLPFEKVPTEDAVRYILSGVIKNKSIIVFPRYAVIAWLLFRISALFHQKVSKSLIRKFRKIRRVKESSG